MSTHVTAPAAPVPPQRIGVLLEGLEGANVSALRYLVLQMNRLQTTFEYEFLPSWNDEFLSRLRSESTLERDTLRPQIPPFTERYRAYLREQNEHFHLKEAPPDYFVVISFARLTEDFYSIRQGNGSVIALGNWERFMAPPSILEFILVLLVREAVASISRQLRGSVHLGTKGCLFDFTASLDEVRIKVLSGFVCHHCSRALALEGYSELPSEIRAVVGKQWLGRRDDPASPAGIVSKLGYDLFTTKGLSATKWERLVTNVQEEGVKQLIALTGTVVIAALLLWLGLKSPSADAVVRPAAPVPPGVSAPTPSPDPGVQRGTLAP